MYCNAHCKSYRACIPLQAESGHYGLTKHHQVLFWGHLSRGTKSRCVKMSTILCNVKCMECTCTKMYNGHCGLMWISFLEMCTQHGHKMCT